MFSCQEPWLRHNQLPTGGHNIDAAIIRILNGIGNSRVIKQ